MLNCHLAARHLLIHSSEHVRHKGPSWIWASVLFPPNLLFSDMVQCIKLKFEEEPRGLLPFIGSFVPPESCSLVFDKSSSMSGQKQCHHPKVLHLWNYWVVFFPAKAIFVRKCYVIGSSLGCSGISEEQVALTVHQLRTSLGAQPSLSEPWTVCSIPNLFPYFFNFTKVLHRFEPSAYKFCIKDKYI